MVDKVVLGVDINSWRENKMSLLQFYSSHQEQREYAATVSLGDHILGEFAEWWFGDYPDETEAFDDVWKAAFTPNELIGVKAFSDEFEFVWQELRYENLNIDGLISNIYWKQLGLKALLLKRKLEVNA